MLNTELPKSSASLETRSLVACLAAILDESSDVLPCIEVGDAWPKLREALATRGLGLVPVLDPGRFSWGGWWIARFAEPDGAAAEPWVVMAGTPSDVVFAPAGTGAADAAAIVEGWVPTRPALDLPRDPMRTLGVIEDIYRSSAPDEASESLDSAVVTAAGLDGDRYARGYGHFSASGRGGEALTLIEAESLDLLARDHGIELARGAHRRNIVTRGIDLNSLVGREIGIGGIRCSVQRVAEPCSWLQRTTPPGTLRGLVHRGGIRVDVIVPGVVRIGDRVRAIE